MRTRADAINILAFDFCFGIVSEVKSVCEQSKWALARAARETVSVLSKECGYAD